MDPEALKLIPWLMPVIIVVGIWDAVWKAISLWKSARNGHLGWFIFLIILNTAGILPIIYILTHRKKAQ